MPGNYGPPFMRLACVRREPDEILYRDATAVRIGAVCKAAIFCVVASGWAVATAHLVRVWMTEGAVRDGFMVFNSLLAGVGCAFIASMLPSVWRETREAFTRREWRLRPEEHRVEFLQRPPRRAIRRESFDTDMARRVLLEDRPWRGGQKRHWFVWLALADDRTLCVDHGREEEEMCKLAADFAATLAVPCVALSEPL